MKKWGVYQTKTVPLGREGPQTSYLRTYKNARGLRPRSGFFFSRGPFDAFPGSFSTGLALPRVKILGSESQGLASYRRLKLG